MPRGRGVGEESVPLECAAAQVCGEAGARVSSNMFVRDMDLATFTTHWMGEGLRSLWTGSAIDTTMVSPLRRDGTARPRAANHDGAVLEVARRRKEATYPELSGENGRARLVVLAAEVGGRWNRETAQFITGLAKSTGSRSSTGVARPRPSCFGEKVECHPCLHSSARFLRVVAGLSSPQWHGGDNPFHP